MTWSPIRQRQLLTFLSVLACMLATGMLLAISDHGVFFPFQWTADYTKKSYGITIDAGSHGTRGHLYEWSGRVEDPQNPQLRPVTVPIEIFTYEPGLKGISEFVERPSNVGSEVLKPIIEAMKKELDMQGCSETRWASVPVYVKATAGMRNMDADTAEGIFNAIRSYLLDSGNPFEFKPDWARVISGEEEGVFGWLAVNSEHSTLLEPAVGTIGALDLGGASAQITFMPTTASVLEDFYEVDLGERVVRLYSHSFLGYGWDDSRMRVTTRLAMGSFFNALAEDVHALNQDVANPKVMSADEIANAFLAGNMASFKPLTHPLSAKNVKHAIYLDAATEHLPTYVLQAAHPCVPRGYDAYFDLPSLLYPDGRFFLDIDDRAIIAYMAAIGYDLSNHVVTKNFPHALLEQAKTDPLSHTSLKPVMDNVLETFNYTSSDSAAKRLSLAAEESAPFHPFVEPLPAPKMKYRVLFNGSGDMQKCQALAKQYEHPPPPLHIPLTHPLLALTRHLRFRLFYKEPCFLSSCSYNGVYQPRVGDSRFLALGQFAKVRAALDIPVVSTPNTIENRAMTVCGTNWANMTAQQQQGQYAPYGKSSISQLCWKAVWTHAMLTTGYGFDGDSHAITFFDITNPDGAAKSPGWALGAMLNEVSSMPWESARGRFQAPFWWAFATGIVLILLACLQAAKIKRLRQKLPQTRSDIYVQYSPAEQLIQP
ncbi:putative nucleoside phosphatase [Gregarina niphandrodes]|uniref:Nucleoside phosphatase n=1 Tax=Gregarina niphandrodes TaxID=110365 RepID=A0A023B1E7_GRENI|nr:putative nucleoside phosphatase [Gregarina niphandrodes]EZG46517.1 putative nucleoside phosphatase [Gregarina niphandrodes]|eukprot:XP_011132290.1 putative nucleoside phosphatase [Gregarina niphandrodes]